MSETQAILVALVLTQFVLVAGLIRLSNVLESINGRLKVIITKMGRMDGAE